MCACCAYQRSAKRESSLIILSLFSHDDWRFFTNEETFLHSFSNNLHALKKKKENGFLEFERKKKTTKKIMGKQVSGAQKRKKKKEKEELAAETERLKLGPTQVMDRVGRASQGCVRLARLVEIEYRRIGGSLQKRIQRVKMCSSTPG